MPDARPETLAAIEAAVWRELAAATHDSAHGWRRQVLATRAGDGADARTLVLRELDAEARTLFFYTDARSHKAAQVAQHPAGTIVAWCPALSWQLRMRVRLELEVEGLSVSSRWARLALTPAARDYMAPSAPGTPLDTPAVPARAGRTHFALLSARVGSIDWLELGDSGHRRASFDAAGARWLVP
ncbi:MAG: pyridoxamine 5'-phosphate oxidase family protein [Rubrivivax sp.]|nr:pyridoxamine 5'-phosphate oxidase family protein [Rubrivivax sp.]